MKFAHEISFEGVECTGKTVFANKVSHALNSLGRTCTVAQEFPTDDQARVLINTALARSIFIGKGFEAGPIPAFFFMLYADSLRRASISGESEFLIHDRNLDSLVLYQGTFVSEKIDPVQLLRTTERLYTQLGVSLPELTILFVSTPDRIKSRFEQREGRLLTTSELTTIVRLQRDYERIAKEFPRYAIVDVDGPEKEVESEIIQRVLDLSKRKRQ